MPLPIMECDDKAKKEEYFPKVSLDDEVLSEEPIHERDMCIHISTGKSEASFNPQTTAYPQKPIHKAVTWEEALSNLLSDMPDVVDDPKEALIQEYLFKSLV